MPAGGGVFTLLGAYDYLWPRIWKRLYQDLVDNNGDYFSFFLVVSLSLCQMQSC